MQISGSFFAEFLLFFDGVSVGD